MMKNVFFMSVFALFMTVAFAGQSVSSVSFVESAYADSKSDSKSKSKSIAFSCPEGITTCYRADGSEYTDVNNLSATAAGKKNESDEYESDDDAGSTAKYAKPRQYRSF